jgi:curved DNA-binding protein
MPAAHKDYYEILGIPRTATEDDVRKEYRKLARKHHPDINPGDKSAEDKFKEINEAYEVLSDSDKRKRYDNPAANGHPGAGFRPPPGGSNGQSGFHGAGDSADFADIFESMFGRQSGQRGRPGASAFRMEGEDINASILLTLEESHRGVVRSLELASVGPDAKSKRFEVTIPPGVREGSVVRLSGQGEPGRDGAAAGDLYLHIEIQPNRLFQILGDDIQIDLPVSPWEAILGGKVKVPTLERPVEMTIPPGSQSGQRLRLREQGLRKRGGGRGNEYVKLKIVVPSTPTGGEKELFQQLATESQFDPRESLAVER